MENGHPMTPLNINWMSQDCPLKTKVVNAFNIFCLIEFFCDGINQPLQSELRREGPK